MPLAMAPPPLLVTNAVPSLGAAAVTVQAATATGLLHVWSVGGSSWEEAGMTGFTAWLEATNASMALYKNNMSSWNGRRMIFERTNESFWITLFGGNLDHILSILPIHEV